MKPCATCRYFARLTAGDTAEGECRRRSPHPIVLKGGDQKSIWPIVHQASGCGEHAPIEHKTLAQSEQHERLSRGEFLPGVDGPPF